MISAKVLADSVSPQGKRLTTFELRYPKFIHGEAKTHRLLRFTDEGAYEFAQEVGLMDDRNLSRNASSSRAIPTAKLLEEVRSDELRATPSFSVVNAPGMAGGRPTTEEERALMRGIWKQGALAAAVWAEIGLEAGAAKQDINRMIEPYTHINVVCSGTEFDNFFGLRLDKGAQPDMRQLAIAMWEAKEASKPVELAPGDWHLPYADDKDTIARVYDYCMQVARSAPGLEMLTVLQRVSVARCARVSYRNFESGNISSVADDLKLFEKLVGAQPLHASPAEHQATPDQLAKHALSLKDEICWEYPEEHGNLIGWRQFRKMLPGESLAPIPSEFING